MSHKFQHRFFAILAIFLLCLSYAMAAEEKNAPPPAGHRVPLGQQFNVRDRIKTMLEDLRENEPEEYQRLMKLREENREKYLQELRQRMPEREDGRGRKITETDRQCWKLGEKFRQATSEQEKESIKAELSALLEQSMQLVIQDSKERLERIQAMLDHLNNNREKIIEQRFEQFLSGEKPFPPLEKSSRRPNRPGKPRK